MSYPQIQNRMRLKTKMRNLLVAADLKGVPHAEFIQKVRTQVFPSKVVREILADWHSRDLVQKFSVRTPISKKPVTVWRATQRILIERL